MEETIDTTEQSNEDEKLIPASRVNEIVQARVNSSSEKTRMQMQEQFQKQLDELKAGMQQNQPVIDKDEIYAEMKERLMQEAAEAQKKQEEEARLKNAEQVVGQYYEKMKSGPSLAEDFEEIVADFDPNEFPQIVFLASQLENTPEIIYELSKNPLKLTQLNSLAQSSPKMAKKQLEALSGSIQKNQEALQNNQSANAPLSKFKPSSTAGQDGGKMGLNDYKKAAWLKG